MSAADDATTTVPRADARLAEPRHGRAASVTGPRLRALLVVSRPEYMPGGLFFIFGCAAVACLTWTSLADNLGLILAGTAVWYLSHLIGSQINCLHDVELDRAGKPRLSSAVIEFGPRALARVIWLEGAVTLAVTVLMALHTGKPVLPILWLAAAAIAVAYSVEPIRLKRRGWLNPLSLVVVLYMEPMAYGYVTLADSASAAVLGVLVGTGLQMLALILLNPAEDIASDRAGTIDTPCVRHGLHRIAPFAAAVFTIGTIVGLASFGDLVSGREPAVVVALAIAAVGQLFVLQELLRLAMLAVAAVRRGETSDASIARLVTHNALHFALLGTTFAAATALILR